MSSFDTKIRTLVIGLGNPILADDGVGIEIARTIRQQLGDSTYVSVEEDTHGGLRLMEKMVGFDRALIVDAICSGSAPGTVFDLALDDIPSAHSGSSHDATLVTALEVGRHGNATLPPNPAIRIVAVEAADLLNFGEGCTPAVAAAIPRAVAHIHTLLATPGPKWPPACGVIASAPALAIPEGR